VNSRGVDALVDEVDDRSFGVREQDSAEVVGKTPVGLLRHGLIEAPKAGLDVRNRNLELRSGERRRERGIDVAGYDAECRAMFEQDSLHAYQRLGRLLGVRSRPYAEEDVRLW
jgi:hypothetical protein